ncbi:MAG: hypothetical protein KDD42_08955, partial [Bdellovibrionales bacterium]|nr:hypothetical protein [Bdellovibrionales bacterium]
MDDGQIKGVGQGFFTSAGKLKTKEQLAQRDSFQKIDEAASNAQISTSGIRNVLGEVRSSF